MMYTASASIENRLWCECTPLMQEHLFALTTRFRNQTNHPESPSSFCDDDVYQSNDTSLLGVHDPSAIRYKASKCRSIVCIGQIVQWFYPIPLDLTKLPDILGNSQFRFRYDPWFASVSDSVGISYEIVTRVNVMETTPNKLTESSGKW